MIAADRVFRLFSTILPSTHAHLVIHAAAVEVVEGGPLDEPLQQVRVVGLARRRLPPLPPESAAAAGVGEAETERRLRRRRRRRRRRGRGRRRERREGSEKVKDVGDIGRDSAAAAAD